MAIADLLLSQEQTGAISAQVSPQPQNHSSCCADRAEPIVLSGGRGHTAVPILTLSSIKPLDALEGCWLERHRAHGAYAAAACHPAPARTGIPSSADISRLPTMLQRNPPHRKPLVQHSSLVCPSTLAGQVPEPGVASPPWNHSIYCACA